MTQAPEPARAESRPSFDETLRVMQSIVPNLDSYNGETVPRRAREFVEFLTACSGESLAGKTVADLGAGNGGPLLWMCLEAAAAKGIAVEQHPDRVMIMEGVIAELGIEMIDIAHVDFASFEPDEASVDVVSVMDLAPARSIDLPQLAELAARMLRPGGYIVLKGANSIYRYRGVKRQQASQLMPLELADLAEAFFVGDQPQHAMYAAPAFARLLLRTGFDRPAFCWASGAQWRRIAKPRRAYPCLSHWYLAARRAAA